MKFQYIFLLIIVFLTYVQAQNCKIKLHGDWDIDVGPPQSSVPCNNGRCYGLNCPNIHDVNAPSNCCYTFYDQYACKGNRIGEFCGYHHFKYPISPLSACIRKK